MDEMGEDEERSLTGNRKQGASRMERKVEIEPLVGEEREERAILDFCSWTVFSLDFARTCFGKNGPILLGRHWGSL